MCTSRRNTYQLHSKSINENDDLFRNGDNISEALKEETSTEEALKLSFDLDKNVNKMCRFESHRDFLQTCLQEQLVPNGLRIRLEPSIGNHDQEFLQSIYESINKCEVDCMQKTVKFCEKTISESENQAKSLDNQLKQKLNDANYKAVTDRIKHHRDDTRRILKQRKSKKLNSLRFGKNQKPKSAPPPKKTGATFSGKGNWAGAVKQYMPQQNFKTTTSSNPIVNAIDNRRMKFNEGRRLANPNYANANGANANTKAPQFAPNYQPQQQRNQYQTFTSSAPLNVPNYTAQPQLQMNNVPIYAVQQDPQKNEQVAPVAQANMNGQGAISQLQELLSGLQEAFGAINAIGERFKTLSAP